MAPGTIQPGVIGAKMSRTTGVSRNAAHGDTQQQCRHQSVHHKSALGATKNLTQDARFKMLCKTGSGKNMTQHAIGLSPSISV